MDKNKSDNFIYQNEVLSKGIKKVLLAIAVVTTTTGVFAQPNEMNNTKNQDIKNKNTLDKNYNQNSVDNHPDGYMMQNGKVVMIKNGVVSPLEKDFTFTNGTTISKDGTYIIKGGTKTTLKEGEHMDLTGKIVSMDKSKNYHKSESEKSSKKDTMYLINDSTKNKMRKK